MSDLKNARTMLLQGSYTLVGIKKESVWTSMEKGIRPLLYLLDHHRDFDDYAFADRIVGKAAAFLYLNLGIRQLYAEVITKQALQILQEAKVDVLYDVLTTQIVNRRGDGLCPMEETVQDIIDPYVAEQALRMKVSELTNNHQKTE